MREQSDLLDHIADMAPELDRFAVRDIAAADEDAPGCRLDQPVHHPHRRSFAATGRADQHANLPRLDRQVEAIDGRLHRAGKQLGDMFQADRHALPIRNRRVHQPLQRREGNFRQESQGCDSHGPGDQLREVEIGHSAGDQLAQPAATDESGQRRRRDDLDGGRADAGENDGQGERELDRIISWGRTGPGRVAASTMSGSTSIMPV